MLVIIFNNISIIVLTVIIIIILFLFLNRQRWQGAYRASVAPEESPTMYFSMFREAPCCSPLPASCTHKQPRSVPEIVKVQLHVSATRSVPEILKIQLHVNLGQSLRSLRFSCIFKQPRSAPEIGKIQLHVETTLVSPRDCKSLILSAPEFTISDCLHTLQAQTEDSMPWSQRRQAGKARLAKHLNRRVCFGVLVLKVDHYGLGLRVAVLSVDLKSM